MQQQEQEIPPEKHEVAVRLVLLDVIVTKGGEFVKDLTKDDFELFEDGKKVAINSFELIKTSVELASGKIWNLGTDMGNIPQHDATYSGADSRLYETMMRMDYLYKELNKFEKTIGGILAAVNMIMDLPARKYLLLISGGIPDIAPQERIHGLFTGGKE